MTEPSSIEAVLKYYQEEVVPALAAAIVAADRMPAEILNEIRNSVTHLAAATSGVDDATKAKEIEAARRHMKRACLDSLKTAVYYSSKRSDDALRAVAQDLQLPQKIHDRANALRLKRMTISESEGRRTLDDAIATYAALANEYDEFYGSLNKEYAGEAAAMRAEARKREKQKDKWINWVIGGIVGAVLSKLVELIFS